MISNPLSAPRKNLIFYMGLARIISAAFSKRCHAQSMLEDSKPRSVSVVGNGKLCSSNFIFFAFDIVFLIPIVNQQQPGGGTHELGHTGMCHQSGYTFHPHNP